MENAIGIYFILGFCLGAFLVGGLVFWIFKSQLDQLRREKIQSEQQQEKVANLMSSQFEALASRIFEEKSDRFTDQNFKSLSVLIEPFKERLKDFERKVEETYSTERAERGSLRGELNKLLELNVKMSSEAQNLTKALKGDNKTMGNWGEMVLENILERSGLRQGHEYTTQGSDMSLKNDQGKDIKPDVIVHLPDGKHIIVDAKVSLKDYEVYMQTEDLNQKEASAKAHVNSLKNHIDGLSEKKYFSAEKLISPDFVILFMPVEPAFALAFKQKPDLLQYAWEKNIALVSPTTLLTTLRTVAAIWKQDKQEKNSQEIARRGGALYDKFAALVEELQDLGTKLGNVQKTHNQIMNKLSDGQGNLIRQVEMLKELGAKAEKKLTIESEGRN